jgi:hypothetical protein
VTAVPPSRGQLIDIGGRRLRLVSAGPHAAAPIILLEAGAFGFSADWGVVQEKLPRRACARWPTTGRAWGFPTPRPVHATAKRS